MLLNVAWRFQKIQDFVVYVWFSYNYQRPSFRFAYCYQDEIKLNCNLQGSCMFEYLPLKAGDVTGRLTFSSSELGLYQYDLILTATPAGLEAPVHFRACLGTSQVQTCRFVNYSRSKVEYSCKVGHKI